MKPEQPPNGETDEREFFRRGWNDFLSSEGYCGQFISFLKVKGNFETNKRRLSNVVVDTYNLQQNETNLERNWAKTTKMYGVNMTALGRRGSQVVIVLALRWSEFESRWSVQFFCKFVVEKTKVNKRRPGLAL